ncbi:MAG: hypothetical protein ACYDCQ_15610 [Dehalococcoidia bacterium]
MKRIGVPGGVGPRATMDFEARVHAAVQRLIPQHGDEGDPPMAVIYVRYAPIMLARAGAALSRNFPGAGLDSGVESRD